MGLRFGLPLLYSSRAPVFSSK